MFYIILFVSEILALFFLARKVHRGLGNLIFKITRSKKITVYILAILFLPGTIIHELSHFLAGLFLLVPVGEIEFIPEFDDNSIKLGSAGIGKTDSIRRFLIGIAPLIVGTSLILFLVYYFSQYIELVKNSWFAVVFVGILIFEIANTMFLSNKDLEGSWKIYLLLISIFIFLYILGLNFSVDITNWVRSTSIIGILEKAVLFLGIPVFIDLILLGVINIINKS